ncbi:thioredoxin domain-containing protein 16-like [Mya arenaria]|uniref:thioredoxin domain-containing protein 16-like n=1 Tax=Mya arenaria TaxID=6604 RepID=UPI0022E5D306|nr:thioredoxin domain-containing protein 16-like [Mya arenaria]XP_052766373.1 thioredoxin domain-containing protein 16-like [Mya arenaria]XP_052766374.1 thioredoxin domain-containing protein 16-like [Mya arenaria]
METTQRIAILVVLLYAAECLDVDFESAKITQLYNRDEVAEFTKAPQVTMMYFYKKDVKYLKYFFKELIKSSEYLDLYGVKVGFVNCKDDSNRDVHDCSRPDTENNVHTYRNGNPLLQLELETLFDVNAILSNMLQLVLLKDVPILQNREEVERYLKTQRGKKDIVFGHMKAIGTLEHRVFMEVAYAYMDKLKFVVCTDKKGTKMFDLPPHSKKDKLTLWWVWTEQMGPDDTRFHNIRYKGETSLTAIARFIKVITNKKMYDMPANGMDPPYLALEVPVVQFYYDQLSMSQVHQTAHVMSRFFGGNVGIVLINTDAEEVKKMIAYQGLVPAVSITMSKDMPEKFLPETFTTDNIAGFLENELGGEPMYPDLHDDHPESDHEEGEPAMYDDDMEEMDDRPPDLGVEEVENQDDRVAEAVLKTKRLPMTLDRVPALTDKTFPSVVGKGTITLVLFYFPFDSISMANLRMFGESVEKLSEQTTLSIARVNCYDWTDVCGREDINIYPILRIYRLGKKAWDYSGPQDVQAMFTTMKLLELSPPVYVQDGSVLMEYLIGRGVTVETNLKGVTNITVTGIFSDKNKKEMEIFKTLAEQSRERIMFVYSDIKEVDVIAKQFKTALPAVFLSKYDDSIQPVVTFQGKFHLDNLHTFITDNKLPKLGILTPLMFPEIRQHFSSLLIVFTDNSDKSQESADIVRELVKTQHFNNISFNMMPVSDSSSVGYKVLKKYTMDTSLPHISLVNLNKGEVFNYGEPEVGLPVLTQWLEGVTQGNIPSEVKLTSGDWTPKIKGYNFLKIMEWEAERDRRKQKVVVKNQPVPDEIPMDEYSDAGEKMDQQSRLQEDQDDSDTRRDLLELQGSRLYNHGHGHHKEGQGHGLDQGHMKETEEKMGVKSDEHDSYSGERTGVDENNNEMKTKTIGKHDPSEL